MRFFGHNVRFKLPAFQLGLLFLLIAGGFSSVLGQTAPYVLPSNMSTYAGPHLAYTAGSACSVTNGATSNLIALDPAGDGCLASQVEVGADPHDIRVDPKGNVYWIDDGTEALVHKIDAQTLQESVYIGSYTNSKPCSAPAPGVDGSGDTAGDGCTSTDGGANNNPAVLTTSSKFKAQRGLATAPNGDLYTAGYNDYDIHKVSAATDLFSIVAGTSAAGTTTSITSGPISTVPLDSPRGVGVDAAGNVYIANTSENIIEEVINGNVMPLTGANSAGTKVVTSGVAALNAQVDAPEDVKVDSNGNVYIADAGNNCVRAIYEGTGTLPGIPNSSLATGFIYTIAGSCVTPVTGLANTTASPPVAASNPTYTYASNGTTPTVLATTVALAVRKIALDSQNNLYIADSTWNVVWFVDHATGYIRLLAGRYYSPFTATQQAGAAGNPAIGCAVQSNTLGDGCAAALASLYAASDMGVSADNQGNVYITDAEGGVAGSSRLRKSLSGLNFPAVAVGTSVTQNVTIHFAPGDTFGTGTLPTSDFSVGTPMCTVETDATDDCIIPITFKPTEPGDDTATLAVTSTLGGKAAFLITGTGTGANIDIDPGTVTVLTSGVNNPQAAVVDGTGNVYVADTANNRVLRIASPATGGATTTFAGTGTANYTGDGGAATAATLKAPQAVMLDTSGNVYIADSGNNVVRRVSAAGIISTFAGGATTVCAAATDTVGDSCPATQATFAAPAGLAMDNLGQIYVSDTGHNLVRQISLSGYVSTLAGGAAAGCTTATDSVDNGCTATQATLSAPAGLAYDFTGNYLFIADSGNSIIRKVYLANAISIITGSTAGVATVIINPITLVAGNGQAGSSIASSGLAIGSQLNKPTGVAVDPAENIYISDTGNDAIRLVSSSTGVISTIVGINTSAGTGTLGSASSVQLTNPGGVAVAPSGQVYVADSGNNRILTDARGQITYNFGRTNVGFSSPVESFTEVSGGTSAATLASPLYVASGNTTQFTLTTPAGTAGCTPGETLALGASCILQGQFTPTTTGTFAATYTETGASNGAGSAPSITLDGTGAVLTTTTSTVAQTAPTGNSVYGGSLTLTATVTPASCNTAAPSCTPTGTVRILVDGVAGSPVTLAANGTASQSISGLSVGNHTISCNYSGDNFYAASTCGNVTITVAQAPTTSTLTATNNNQPQYPKTNCTANTKTGNTTCVATTLTATVVSSTIGVPTGSVTFYSGTTSLGIAPLNASGVAVLPLSFVYATAGGNFISDNTLPPGTYSLTCTYTGVANYALSNCTPISFTVLADSQSLTLVPVGCAVSQLYIAGTTTPNPSGACPSPQSVNGVPEVSTAQGATTDATIFITPSNTVSGPVTVSCSGMPANSDCTFSPSNGQVTFTAGTGAPVTQFVDVTFFTDLLPGEANSGTHAAAKAHAKAGAALMLGWPFTLVGLLALIRLRRKSGSGRGLSVLAMLLLMTGSSLLFTGCGLAGPGAYKANVTPAGVYPITITVSTPGASATTTVDLNVTAPGIPGQE